MIPPPLRSLQPTSSPRDVSIAIAGCRYDGWKEEEILEALKFVLKGSFARLHPLAEQDPYPLGKLAEDRERAIKDHFKKARW